MKLYFTGYSGSKLDAIKARLIELDGILLDIRFNPYSHHPRYMRAALEREFAGRYLWLKEFGNRAYKKPGACEFMDYVSGAHRLECIADGIIPSAHCWPAAVLMCGCQFPEGCHRTVLAARLQRDGFDCQGELLELPVASASLF